MPGIAIGDYAADRSESEYRDLAAEPRRTQEQFRMREPVNQPALRHVLHPCSDERDGLPEKQQAEVSMAECAERLPKSPKGQRGGLFSFWFECGDDVGWSRFRGTF